MRSIILCVGFSIAAFGQGLPDRDKLTEELMQLETRVDATRGLVESYQLGGIRTILRNLGEMPLESRMDFAQMFQGLDLFRFRNDLNTNLNDSKEKESKALFLMLMSQFGRKVDLSVFEQYANDEDEVRFVRLAAATGLVKFQNPKYYDLFVSLTEDIDLDLESAENDFRFADISMGNKGFYYYVQTKLTKEESTHGYVMTALVMATRESSDLYAKILNLRQRKYVPLMINRAIEVGGVELLEMMREEKACKKFRDEIEKAIPAAKIVAEYWDKLFDRSNPEQYPIRPLTPFDLKPRGMALNRSYAIVNVSATGEMHVVEEFGPFCQKAEALRAAFEGKKTFPAYLEWNPVESLILVSSN